MIAHQTAETWAITTSLPKELCLDLSVSQLSAASSWSSWISQVLKYVYLSLKAGFHYNDGVVIRSVELYDLVKQRCDSAYDSAVYDQVKTGSSKSQEEAEELNKSQSVGTCLVIGLSFCFCFRLRQSGFHSIIRGTKRRSHKGS